MADGAAGAGAGAVFVSYARPDKPTAAAVIRILEDAGFRVWWDDLIAGGDSFSASINDALEAARAVIVLWSSTSIRSDWVRDEAMHGRDRGCLVPLSIDGAAPPLGFRQLHYLDVSGDGLRADSEPMQRALTAVAALLGRDAPPPTGRAEPVAKAPGANVTRRALLATGAGVTVAAIGVTGWRLTHRGATSLPNSIAVLPFNNLGGDPAQRYFSDGLSAELRAQLARNPLLTVMGQTSSNGFRDDAGDSRTIAQKLNVAYLLDGNVRVAAGSVRIAIELVEGATGFSKWSDSFDGPMTDIFQLQERIAQAVDTSLAARLAGPSSEPATRSGGSSSVPAFDAYLRGRALFESQRDESSDRAALGKFEEAIRLDPHYAAARAARSRTLAVIANQYVQSAERRSLYAGAVEEAQTAIRDAPDFADGHAALGYALFYGTLDVVAADAPYEAAQRLGNGSADVLSRYALYRARRRQFDRAVPAIARAITLDPLNPSVFKTEGLIRFAQGDYASAISSAGKALAINPERGTINGDIGNALLMLGRLDDAEKAFAREKVGLLSIPGRAFIAARRHDLPAVDRALAELIAAFGDNGLYQQAQVLAQAGRPAEALGILARARKEWDSGLVLAFNDPFLAPLRATDGYQALLRDLHFV